jgi:hypothetical protein
MNLRQGSLKSSNHGDKLIDEDRGIDTTIVLEEELCGYNLQESPCATKQVAPSSYSNLGAV